MPEPIRRILIANRGEIALRIAATCAKMGIESVTVYSDADAHLPHARAGTLSRPLPGVAPKDTYLNQSLILEAAKATGADAIHPGYGFLSENAGFAAAVREAGLIFIGPAPEVIALMGDKTAARAEAERAGVPVVPGFQGDVQDEATLRHEAARIGYPLLIKAAAGGGGKGMKRVEHEADFAAQLELAKSEAQSAFGDGRVFLEKYITNPRHIEIQVFSDGQGNHLHFYERECSLQRRHQKIIEETPARALTPETRVAMAASAVALCRAVNYTGAGTIEYILGDDGHYYFLEMNTRLQVEHPVTEAVCGVDLVRLQILAAEGRPLPLAQADIRQRGHAIEARVYAEDPAQGFLPSTGTLSHIGAPALPNVRFDCGFTDGNAVTPYYDPMLAKITAWAETREEAASLLAEAIRRTPFLGVTTNRALLLAILASPEFAENTVTTDLIERHGTWLTPAVPDDATMAAAAATYLLGNTSAATTGTPVVEPCPWTTLQGFRST